MKKKKATTTTATPTSKAASSATSSNTNNNNDTQKLKKNSQNSNSNSTTTTSSKNNKPKSLSKEKQHNNNTTTMNKVADHPAQSSHDEKIMKNNNNKKKKKDQGNNSLCSGHTRPPLQLFPALNAQQQQQRRGNSAPCCSYVWLTAYRTSRDDVHRQEQEHKQKVVVDEEEDQPVQQAEYFMEHKTQNNVRLPRPFLAAFHPGYEPPADVHTERCTRIESYHQEKAQVLMHDLYQRYFREHTELVLAYADQQEEIFHEEKVKLSFDESNCRRLVENEFLREHKEYLFLLCPNLPPSAIAPTFAEISLEKKRDSLQRELNHCRDRVIPRIGNELVATISKEEQEFSDADALRKKLREEYQTLQVQVDKEKMNLAVSARNWGQEIKQLTTTKDTLQATVFSLQRILAKEEERSGHQNIIAVPLPTTSTKNTSTTSTKKKKGNEASLSSTPTSTLSSGDDGSLVYDLLALNIHNTYTWLLQDTLTDCEQTLRQNIQNDEGRKRSTYLEAYRSRI